MQSGTAACTRRTPHRHSVRLSAQPEMCGQDISGTKGSVVRVECGGSARDRKWREVMMAAGHIALSIESRIHVFSSEAYTSPPPLCITKA